MSLETITCFYCKCLDKETFKCTKFTLGDIPRLISYGMCICESPELE